MRNIQVFAQYETDTAPSKFDALLKQYKLAKEIADETESVKQPLIDAMGEAKLALIKKQLGIIADRLMVISELCGGVQLVEAIGYTDVYCNCKRCVLVRNSNTWNHAEIYLDGYTFDHPSKYWFDEDGIVTLWNKLKLYEKLEVSCEEKLAKMIKSQEEKTRNIEQNYENMIRG